MVEEFIVNLYRDRDFLGLFLIALSYCMCWTVFFVTGYFILKNTVSIKEIICYVPAGVLLSLFGKPFLSGLVYAILMYVSFIGILKGITKERMSNVIVATVITFAGVNLSFVIFGVPLLFIDNTLKEFLSHTTIGVTIGAMTELVLPIIVIFICIKKKISLHPRIPEIERSNVFLSIAGLGLIFFLYRSTNKFWMIETPYDKFVDATIASMGFISFCVYIILNRFDKKRAKEERLKLEENHRKKALELATTLTTACKHQIDYTLGSVSEHTVDTFRLCLLNLAETLHKTRSIDDVYDKIIDIASDDLDENPIFKQILMTKRMENMSTRLRFAVTGNHDLKDYNDADFWQLFSMFLNICSKSYTTLNYPINSGRPSDAIEKYYNINIITIAMDEHGDYVAVTIYTSNKIEHTFTSWERMRYHASESDQPYLDIIYKSVENNISDFTYGIVDGHIMSVSYTYKKKTVDEMVL